MWSSIKKIIEKIKVFFIRFFHGSKLSLLSLKAYYHYKKLWLLPLIGSLLFMLVFMGIGWIGWMLHNYFRSYIDQSATHKFFIFAPLVLLLLFCVSCIHVFFNVVAAFMIAQYCDQDHASLMSAIANTCKRKKVIFLWSCMETVVRATSGRRKDESSIVSASVDIWSFILGTSWRYLSFFIYPIFAFEDKKLFESLKKSVELTKKYFGSMSGSLFTFSMVYILVPFIVMGYFMVLSLLVKNLFWLLNSSAAFNSGNPKYLIFLVFLPNLAAIFWFVVEFISLAKTITSTILYRYVNDLPTGIFNRETLDAAVRERE